MIGLVRKDFLLMMQSWKIIVALLALLAVLLGTSPGFEDMFVVPFALALVLSFSAFGYDRQAKWDQYVTTLPVEPTAVVGSRYIVVFLLWLASYLICLCASFLFVWHDMAQWEVAKLFIISVGWVMLALLALILPLFYRFGPDKGRIVLLIMFVALTFLGRQLPQAQGSILCTHEALCLIGALSLYIVSWTLSTVIYRKTDHFS